MADEELITLLKEIRDLQKVQIANSQEIIKTSAVRVKKAQKIMAITLAIFLFVMALIIGLPYLLSATK